jgi:lipopolysaccharide/colanic/teichoic acid biosynthesis glycosyltransferase
MTRLNDHKKQQFIYVAADILSSLIVWLCFLFFRWLVWDGKVFGIHSMLIPAFNFYTPLLIYPIACLIIHYLSGYYLRPFNHSLTRDLRTTFFSSLFISLGAFFAIIIDDPVKDYHNYLGSLLVLFLLQFFVCYLMRLAVTLFTRSHHNSPDNIIIDLPQGASEQELFEAIKAAYPTGKEIFVKPHVRDILIGATRIPDLEGETMIHITDYHMTDAELCIKRAADIVVSFIALLLLSPLCLAIAIAVRTSSQGPVIYRQERIGLYGKPFHILKFRTMFANAEQQTPLLTATNDPRVTHVGKVLRKYRLDELPQMWNVLRGDMSLVGPRPERAYFIAKIEQHAPYYCLLYKIRPGLTSWGPIKVGYTDTMDKMVQRLNYDIAYMENMSLILDTKILLLTIDVILHGRGK